MVEASSFFESWPWKNVVLVINRHRHHSSPRATRGAWIFCRAFIPRSLFSAFGICYWWWCSLMFRGRKQRLETRSCEMRQSAFIHKVLPFDCEAPRLPLLREDFSCKWMWLWMCSFWWLFAMCLVCKLSQNWFYEEVLVITSRWKLGLRLAHMIPTTWFLITRGIFSLNSSILEGWGSNTFLFVWM